MSYGWWFVVILVTALMAFGWGTWVGVWVARPGIPLAPQSDPAPAPPELPRARLFPVDTGPLLLLSEKAAANIALEREIRALGDAAERKIGPVQP